jgi:hypothetical protein
MNLKFVCFAAALVLACLPIAAQTSISSSPAAAPKAPKSAKLLSTPKTNTVAAAKDYTPPKTAWGDPDLQGEWPAYANIPMQRPASFGNRAFLTDEEFAKRAKQAV